MQLSDTITFMKKNIKKLIVLFYMFITVCTAVFAADSNKNVMYVAAAQLEVKETASMNSKNVQVLVYGSSVKVENNKGKWSYITTDSNVSGWVISASLSKRKLTSKNMTVNVKELALAGKGANAGIEAAIDKLYTEYFDLVDKIENNKVSEDKVQEFIKEGKLNGGEE